MERIQKDSRTADNEERLKKLLLRGLDGDAVAYHGFLKELSAYLRGFFRKRLFGWPDEVEDLVQETLLAVHKQRHTYRVDQPLTPGCMRSPATSWWTCCAGAGGTMR